MCSWRQAGPEVVARGPHRDTPVTRGQHDRDTRKAVAARRREHVRGGRGLARRAGTGVDGPPGGGALAAARWSGAASPGLAAPAGELDIGLGMEGSDESSRAAWPDESDGLNESDKSNESDESNGSAASGNRPGQPAWLLVSASRSAAERAAVATAWSASRWAASASPPSGVRASQVRALRPIRPLRTSM
jgi:hypothetical protein